MNTFQLLCYLRLTSNLQGSFSKIFQNFSDEKSHKLQNLFQKIRQGEKKFEKVIKDQSRTKSIFNAKKLSSSQA